MGWCYAKCVPKKWDERMKNGILRERRAKKVGRYYAKGVPENAIYLQTLPSFKKPGVCETSLF